MLQAPSVDSGDPRDVAEAVQVCRAAVAATSAGDTEWSGRMSNLGLSPHVRYQFTVVEAGRRGLDQPRRAHRWAARGVRRCLLPGDGLASRRPRTPGGRGVDQ